MLDRKKLIADSLHCTDEDIGEKTDEQLDYILSPIDRNIYLEACAGSGKTEVLGMKAAYEIKRWNERNSGLAILTFTNEARDTISNRVNKYLSDVASPRHFIGTTSSFIHGYIAQRLGCRLYSETTSSDGDLSFKVIDPQSGMNNNQWLKNYAIKNKKGQLIPVNQLNLMRSGDGWLVVNHRGCDSKISLSKTAGMKHKFWADHFATYDDMNCIALNSLRGNADMCKLLSKRFPVIFIDECQDLSLIELMIMSKLIESGSTVHYIGDLHQSIYGFRQSDPLLVQQYIDKYGFRTMNLTRNFRSSQNIVDVSCAIEKIEGHLFGVSNKSAEKCLYFEYANEKDIIEKFATILKERNMPFDKAVILCRGKSLVERVCGGDDALGKNEVIYSIALWLNGDAEAKRKALIIMSRLICKWGRYRGVGDYCMPEKLQETMGQVKWRLLVSYIMKELCSNDEVGNLKLTYGEWYKKNKVNVCNVINRLMSQIDSKFHIEINMLKSAKNTTKKMIECKSARQNSAIKVMTIHASKGCTFDAVLLVSSKNRSGKDGYWENWLNANGEAGRICYVACTRPRYLLCWAVGKLSNNEQRKKLESLGLVRLE